MHLHAFLYSERGQVSKLTGKLFRKALIVDTVPPSHFLTSMSLSVSRILHPSRDSLPTQQGANPRLLVLCQEGPPGNPSPDRVSLLAKLQNETAQGKENPSQDKDTQSASQQLFAESL